MATTYTAPLRDMEFVLFELLEVDSIDKDLCMQVLDEGGKFASKILAPLNAIGDAEGCKLNHADHSVKTPAGFKGAYEQFVAGGWPALACAESVGGQGLPTALNTALYEEMNSANQAWTMYPGLSHGAYECLSAHGTEKLRAEYLPKLACGELTGTMCLTEAHCGTDLGLIRTKAVKSTEGATSETFLLSGEKIFISAGEHDLTDNILHLVLARVEGDKRGTKGLSLFVAPKILPDGSRNNVYCGAIEHKMGINGSSTCQMVLDGSKAWLVGEQGKGLNAMFVMMNAARLGVGVQSLGLTEAAYQNAVSYAKDRIQMRSLSGPRDKDKEADSILVHPDVRRMLMTARAYAEGGRAFAYFIAQLIDRGNDKDSSAMVGALTPVVKAFLSDNAWIATSEAMQVFGGHGYLRDFGAEQFVRDSRINMIYEGTNSVQALDLLARKVLADGGAKLMLFGKMVESFVDENEGAEEMIEFTAPLLAVGETVASIGALVGSKAGKNPEEIGGAATPFLRLVGHLAFSYFFARMAKIAMANLKLDSTKSDAAANPSGFYAEKLATARFYFAKLYPETFTLEAQAKAGVGPLNDIPSDYFDCNHR